MWKAGEEGCYGLIWSVGEPVLEKHQECVYSVVYIFFIICRDLHALVGFMYRVLQKSTPRNPRTPLDLSAAHCLILPVAYW